MDVLYRCCAGLDVHKKTVVACVLITSPDGQVHKQVRTVATTTAGLLALYSFQVRMICYCTMQHAGKPTCLYERIILFLKEY